MSERSIVKKFNNFRGRDVRASDLVRDGDYAIEFDNALITKEDSCVTRQGSKIRGQSARYNGLYTYRYASKETGQTIEELVSLDENLYRLYSGGFSVTYSGSAPDAALSFRLDPATQTFKFTLVANGITILNYDVGTGLEASPITLETLADQIRPIPNFTATPVYEDLGMPENLPAAFLPITIGADLATGSKNVVLDVFQWEVMSRDGANILAPLSSYHSNRGADEWEFASTVNMNDVMYIATGYEYLHKYDGQNVYRAGLPVPDTAPGVSVVSGPGWTDTDVKYIYLYKQVDNRGNVIFGLDSDPSSPTGVSNQKVNLTLQNIEKGTGFNLNCAIVDGTQSPVLTITVDACNTLKKGDTAYFYDTLTLSYVERLVTARTNTSITVDGDPVGVSNNSIISNNLRIVIYRNSSGGNLYYKVAEIPNDAFSATSSYQDVTASASLGTQYIPPTKLRDILEAKPRYLCIHQNLLIASGASQFPNTWYFSNGEGPEYFDAEINFEQIKSSVAGGIKGLASDQEHLIVGTERSLFVVTGDIDAGTSRQERLAERNVGFASHNSIVDIGGRIMFLSYNGFWAIQGGFNLVEIGAPVSPELSNFVGLASASVPRLSRATAVFYGDTDEYICHVPAESGTGVDKYVNSNAVTHIYDVVHNAWGRWTGINLGGGVAVYQRNIYFQSKRLDPFIGVTGNLWERQNTGQSDDYADHNNPISFKFGPQWIDGGEPSVFKVFLWLKAYSLLRNVPLNEFSVEVDLEKDLSLGTTWASFTLDFGALGKRIAKKKLRSGKAKSLRSVITNNNFHEQVILSGLEMVVTAPYSVEMKD